MDKHGNEVDRCNKCNIYKTEIDYKYNKHGQKIPTIMRCLYCRTHKWLNLLYIIMASQPHIRHTRVKYNAKSTVTCQYCSKKMHFTSIYRHIKNNKCIHHNLNKEPLKDIDKIIITFD